MVSGARSEIHKVWHSWKAHRARDITRQIVGREMEDWQTQKEIEEMAYKSVHR